jgi:hypothetical protein
VAIASAGTAALNKVATAVQAAARFNSFGRSKHGSDGDHDGDGGDDDMDPFAKKPSWKLKAATDDIFHEEEKIRLGLRE